MLDSFCSFPTSNGQPTFESLTGWLSGRTFYLSSTRVTGTNHPWGFHFLTPYPPTEQEPQVLEEQVPQALVPAEVGDLSELVENDEGTR